MGFPFISDKPDACKLQYSSGTLNYDKFMDRCCICLHPLKCNLTLILCRKPVLSNLPSQEQVCFNETKEIKTAVEKIECRIETERECQENVVNKCKEVYSDIQCEKVSFLRTYLIQFLLLDSLFLILIN